VVRRRCKEGVVARYAIGAKEKIGANLGKMTIEGIKDATSSAFQEMAQVPCQRCDHATRQDDPYWPVPQGAAAEGLVGGFVGGTASTINQAKQAAVQTRRHRPFQSLQGPNPFRWSWTRPAEIVPPSPAKPIVEATLAPKAEVVRPAVAPVVTPPVKARSRRP